MKFSKTRDVKSPARANPTDAGIDFYIPNDFQNTVLMPGENVLIPSGIKANVPEGYALIAFNKSGVATKKSLYVGASVVDEAYQGEIHIHVTNVGKNSASIEAGDKIMQFILFPMFYDTLEETSIDELYDSISDRGAGGFGSTDHK